MISTSSNKQDSGLETDHAIVGAGVAGIALARRFAQSQQDFMVVEKARSPGGRLATRRDQNTKFDHGAQFYKLDGSAMSLVEHGFNGADLKPWFQREQIQFMCCAQGMNALIKKPAEQFREKIILNMKVQTIIFESSRERPYQLIFEDGSQILARNVYLTCPLPQSLKILSDSNINYQNDLDQIDYAEALVGMLILKKESFNEAEVSKILEFKYQDRVSEDVFSIANQASKGLSDELAFTVVMAPDFSHHNFD